ncbi:hypothetical protein DERP_006278 [Dermatophagoides pteronyssinus]|uniref:Uncharacterized protein n=1 Tax=Dermatophagoides pteronyssinus TaxID=6956 RepID=A0ABQ8IY10_DERPT|nr:hypothetical protein DERP_006278 [Dermatophagoides pteronyssinus]
MKIISKATSYFEFKLYVKFVNVFVTGYRDIINLVITENETILSRNFSNHLEPKCISMIFND